MDSITEQLTSALQNGEQPELKITYAGLKVNEIYPIYGMITNIIATDDKSENTSVVVELNKNIHILLKTVTSKKIELLKERILENAIFISKVQSLEPLALECQTIIFGKKALTNA